MTSRERRQRRRSHGASWKRKLTILVSAIAIALAVAGGVGASWAIDVYNSAPPLSSLKPVQKGRSSAIYAADGSLIGFISASSIRQPVRSRALPQNLKYATVAIEDRNFFEHGAIDPAGIVRAAWKNLQAGGKPVQGASTITQQLVRNLYIRDPAPTIERKLIEAHLAYEQEEKHSKQWILTAYLNTAPYGTVEGETAVGAEAAAQTYFGKPARELELTEAAMIAGLPQAPSEYNPLLDPRAARERRNQVLEAMEGQGYISEEEYEKAIGKGLGLSPGHKYRVIRDRLLFDLVQQELIDKYGLNTVRYGGLKAYTTIDPELQERAQEAVDSCGVCYAGGGPAAGLASVDPSSGEIVALASTEGSEDESEFNYAWQAHRQPGSAFKTFVLAAAIKQGIDPDSTYYDGTSPKTLDPPGAGPPWTVNNAEPGGGTMSLASATWHSTNVVFAQLDLDVGPENVTQTARQMGIEAPLESVPAEALGGLSVGVTPLEMASAYATLASGGIHREATALARVEFPSGEVDEPDPEAGERVLSEGEAYEVTRLLEGVITQGTGAGYTSIGCRAAGKTGTSEELSDAWFAGYTPRFSTAVWVGHPESRASTGYGGTTAGPIWRSYMEAANSGECAEFEQPATLPELSGLDSDQTTDSYGGEEEFEEFEEFDEGEEDRPENDSGADRGGAPGNAAPSPSAPAPAPAPAPSGGVSGGVASG
jgi:penicillin-binding protein 1A